MAWPQPSYPPPYPAPPRRGPGSGWLWLGIALAALAALVFVGWTVPHVDELDAAGASAQSGEGRVRLELHEGQGYGVYVPVDEAGGPAVTTCAVTQGQLTAVPLHPWDGGFEGDTLAELGEDWSVLGRFEAPADGPGTVECEGITSRLLVRPDDDVYVVFGLLLIGCGVVGLGGVVLAIVIAVLRGVRRGAPGTPIGPAGYVPAPAGYVPAPAGQWPSYPPPQGPAPGYHPAPPPQPPSPPPGASPWSPPEQPR